MAESFEEGANISEVARRNGVAREFFGIVCCDGLRSGRLAFRHDQLSPWSEGQFEFGIPFLNS